VYPLVYVEGLNDARTLLADFFSILLEAGTDGNGMSGLAACGWTAPPASAIGRTRAETGEADGDGGPFARRAADGN
jgi:hypothetical protein